MKRAKKTRRKQQKAKKKRKTNQGTTMEKRKREKKPTKKRKPTEGTGSVTPECIVEATYNHGAEFLVVPHYRVPDRVKSVLYVFRSGASPPTASRRRPLSRVCPSPSPAIAKFAAPRYRSLVRSSISIAGN
jgi:hypothetical protein